MSVPPQKPLLERPEAAKVSEAIVRLYRASLREPVLNPEALMNRLADCVVADYFRQESRWRRCFRQRNGNKWNSLSIAVSLGSLRSRLRTARFLLCQPASPR